MHIIQKAPNFIWHIDGHDKLKPLEFSVHGCVDGFFQRLLWLEIGPTNKNPEGIAKFYLDTVKQLGGVPQKIRSDPGTENSVIEPLHNFLRLSMLMKMLAQDVLILVDSQLIKELNPTGHNS